MMLELSLLRHAKSDWDADYSHDRHRPLNDRGTRAARAVGEYVARTGRIPDLALTSSAVRAQTTLSLASTAGAWSTEVEVVSELYSGGPEELLDTVRQVTDAAHLLIVGHEPTMSTSAARLMGGGSLRVPTASLVEFGLPIQDWNAARWGIGELRAFTLARSLVEAGFGNDRSA